MAIAKTYFIENKTAVGLCHVCERRTATGNGTFSLFTRLGATVFVVLSVFTGIEAIYLKIRAHPLPKNEKRPLPVAVRRSKTPLLKLPIYRVHRARDAT